MSDFFSSFRDPTQVAPPSPGGLRDLSFGSQEPDYERNFFERIFAPFEAPQQGLFKLTTSIAEDGFQPSDLMDSLGHAARYFNPWSNERPIDPDEIRRTFMGQEADVTGFAKFGANLAISLLYDPLIFTGLAKGLGLLQDGSTAFRNLERVTNPAGALIEGTRKVATQYVGPAIHAAGRGVMGATKWEALSTQAAQTLVNRFAGIPEDLKRRVMSFDSRVAEWRMEGYDIIRKADRLGGQEGQKILAEALEAEAVYLNRAGGALTTAQTADLARIEKRVRDAGISEDLFYQVYDRARQLDDKIGSELFRTGVIGRDAVDAYRGTHLRRMYEAFEKPLDYIDRLEALAVKRPDLANTVERVSVGALKKSLLGLGDEMAGSPNAFRAVRPTDRAGRAAFGQAVASNPYLTGSRSQPFNTDAFADDLVNWLGQNSESTADDVFRHVNEVMLDGVQMGEGFQAAIGNHLSGAQYKILGIDHYTTKLQELAHGSGTQWRSYSERLEIVSKREDLRDEIAEALGEITTAAPRIAGQAADAGKLLETRNFFDELAGVRRVDDEAGELLMQAKRALTRGEEIPEHLMRDIDAKLDLSTALGRPLKPTDLMELDTGSKIGGPADAAWSSVSKTASHTVQLPKDPTYGEMAGRWVSPGVNLMLRRLQGVTKSGEPASAMAIKAGELIRQGTGQFKMMKVVLDPGAQFTNFIGGMVAMDLQGTNPLRVDKMIKSGSELLQYMRTGKKGRYLTMLEEAGVPLLDSTFSRQELMGLAERVSRDPVTRDNWKSAFRSMYEGILGVYQGGTRAAAKTFEFNEQMFKLDVFIDQYEKIAQPLIRRGKLINPEMQTSIARQAAALAEQALFNYADVPYLVDFARKYGVVPFATFPFKAIPYVADVLYKHPHRVLKYNRVTDEINNSLAGSPEDVAREVQALPQHMREAMVLKMPFKDGQGRDLYADLSFFMPWQPLREMIEQIKDPISGLFGSPNDGPSDYGMRGGILSPPLTVLMDALRHNEDSLGRPIIKDSMSVAEKWAATGKFMWEFWVPPSFPGGSRQMSVGRALQAMATNSPETQDWVNMLGRGMRLGLGQDSIVPRRGMSPQTQAQVDGPLGPAAGTILGLFTGGLSASDPAQARAGAAAGFQSSSTDLARQISAIRTNPTLSIKEKRERIARLNAMRQEQALAYRSYLSGL